MPSPVRGACGAAPAAGAMVSPTPAALARLEPEFWNALDQISKREKMSRDELIRRIYGRQQLPVA